MALDDYHTQFISQTSGSSTWQLSKTGGAFEGFVLASGGGNGFLNVYDSNNGLPLPTAGRVVTSGCQVATSMPTDDFRAELNSGLYVEAYGPVQLTVRWK